jgi:predicted kinase
MEQKFIILRGIQGSGKTSYAQRLLQQNPDLVRVNRDTIRSELFGYGYVKTPANEELVTKVQDHTIRTILDSGKSVIVDNMNIESKFIHQLQDIASSYGIKANIIQFDTPIQKCIENDKVRGNLIGEDIVTKTHNRFEKVKNKPIRDQYAYEPLGINKEGKKAVIFDLDGTLAIIGDRDVYDGSKVHLDTVNSPIRELLFSFKKERYKVIIVSGRNIEHGEVTTQWLKDNKIYYDDLFMRPRTDLRCDAKVKYEIYRDEIFPHYRVDYIIDDRDKVVRMWRQIGLTCLQCNYGDF